MCDCSHLIERPAYYKCNSMVPSIIPHLNVRFAFAATDKYVQFTYLHLGKPAYKDNLIKIEIT